MDAHSSERDTQTLASLLMQAAANRDHSVSEPDSDPDIDEDVAIGDDPAQSDDEPAQSDQGDQDEHTDLDGTGDVPSGDSGGSSGVDAGAGGDGVRLSEGYEGAVTAGRVSTLELPVAARAVRVVDGPETGQVSVNPDQSLALVLTGTTATGPLEFGLEITLESGEVITRDVSLEVTEGAQGGGWGEGQHYKLATGADGLTIVETGEIHEKVHISGSPDALSLADIAALEGIAVADMNHRFLEQNPQYGRSPDSALDVEAGLKLWENLTGTRDQATSHWLLFERGYEYEGVRFPINRDAQGESELHPLYIGAYGTGERPVLTDKMMITFGVNQNIVVQGLELHGGVRVHNVENVLFEDIAVSRNGLDLQGTTGVTFRNSHVIDVIREAPSNDGELWNPHFNRVSGLYAHKTEGLLIENVLFDHTGWADDYRADLSISGGQPPSMYSQNIYINYDNSDVTLRDTISMRAASFGAQVRSGGFIEDNVFIDNNAAVNALSGKKVEDGLPTGNYTLFSGNVVTSGAHKTTDSGPQGALTMGIDNASRDSTMIDNIVAHLADPNDPADLAGKQWGHRGLNASSTHYDDTIVYNWVGRHNASRQDEFDRNTETLDPALLDQTTIQNFAAQLLGDPDAGIPELAGYLRGQLDGQIGEVADADLIIAYFQAGFGLTPDIRSTAETVRFVPSDLADGVRWDNRMNWSTEDLPGTQDGDSVDLGGNRVVFGGTVGLEDLHLGRHGRLELSQGRLDIDGEITHEGGGALQVDRAGQLWVAGYHDTDRLEIDLAGGRFVNTGLFAGAVDLSVSDNAQAILAAAGADFVLGAGSTLSLSGMQVRAGFDGAATGTGTLRFEGGSQLVFDSDTAGFGAIGEFRSGAFGDSPGLDSGVNLGGVEVVVDLRDLGSVGLFDQVLVSADEIIGTLGGFQAVGLGSDRDATLTIDYVADTLSLELTATGQGSGALAIETVGTEATGNPDLIETLQNETAFVDHFDL